MPLADFGSHDPDFSAEQVAECARIVDGLRAINTTFNPATGAFNPMAPKLEMRLEGEKLVAKFAFPSHYESSPDSVQGGMVAACFDQLLAFAVMAHGRTGPTLSLTVQFVKRTPINQPLRFESWVETVDSEKFSARGSCFHGDVKVSEAEALILGKYEMPVVGA